MAKNILAIGVVSDYEEVVNSESKMSYISGTITKENGSVIEVTNDMIVPGSLYTTNQCSNGAGFEIGTVFAAEMGIALRLNDDKSSFYNAKIELSYFVYNDPLRVYQVKLGEFFVSEVKRNRTSITLKAYDNMVQLDKPIDESFTGTIEEALSFISRKCGVQIAEISYESLANSDAIVYVTPGYVATYRDLLSQICKLTFTFGKISWGGTITLVSYSNSPVREISPKIKRSSLVSDFSVSFNKLTGSFFIAELDNEVMYKTYELSEESEGLEYDLGDISILRGDDEQNQAVMSVLFEKLKGINYIPCDISFTGDPSLELGDMVTNVDMDGDRTNFYITFYKWSYRGNHSIKGAGSDPRSSNVKDKTAQMFEKVKEITRIFNARITAEDGKIEAMASKVDSAVADITQIKLDAKGMSGSITQVQKDVSGAAKTATSFLEWTLEEGVILAHKEDDEWVGNKAQILPGYFNILNSDDDVSSSFGDEIIELGKLSESALISMCADKGLIRYGSDGEDFGLGLSGTLSLTSEHVNIQGSETTSLFYQRMWEIEGTNGQGAQAIVGSFQLNDKGAELSVSYSGDLEKRSGEWVGFWRGSLLSMTNDDLSMLAVNTAISGSQSIILETLIGPISIYAGGNLYFSHPGYNAYFNDTVTISQNGDISIGKNKSAFNDKIPGLHFDSDGFIVLQRSGTEPPRISFYLDNSNETDGRIQVNQSNGFMEFTNADGYRFDKTPSINNMKMAPMCSGRVGDISVAANSYTDVEVTFPFTFSNSNINLIVGLASSSSAGSFGSVSAVGYARSSTGATIRVYNASTSAKTAIVYWIATLN